MSQFFSKIAILQLFICISIQANNMPQSFNWPDNKMAAVSLAYDDALASQLDNAIPALNKHNFKGSFYLTLSSPTLKNRLEDWRNVAKQGHELGNHTINHACSRSKQNRDWVEKHKDLDSRSLKGMIQEVENANTFLHAIDGESVRTFTVPCLDIMVENTNYVDLVAPLFVGIKYSAGSILQSKSALNMLKMPAIFPSDVSSDVLINYVKEAKRKGTMVNFTFHGIGAEYLSITNKVHEELLVYLAENKQYYWVDTFRNISLYVQENTKTLTKPQTK